MREFGDEVRLYYEGSTLDGEVFDQRSKDNPLVVRIGMSALPAGLDAAVREMADGEERIVTLEPAEAFGERNEADVVRYPLAALEGAESLEPGDIIRIEGNKTGMRPAFPTVVSNDGFEIYLDFNHPMAGKTVIYHLGVLA